MIRTAALVALAFALPAEAFELHLPVDCTLGETCYIQNYFDHDPGAKAADFTCGPLSYDGHDGTDLAVATRAEMAAGVAVLAAAPGTVTATRDGMADFTPPSPDQGCGNAVLVDHGQGWETAYCHMKQGSVLVRKGDVVQTGTPLGHIGQSGHAEFPHLHLSVRHNDVKLDPFSPDSPACGAKVDDLWAADLSVEPGGLLGIGISTAVPDYAAVKAGLASPDLPADAPGLVVWAYYFGLRTGDILRLSLTGPAGKVMVEDVPTEKTQAMGFRAAGRKLKTSGWPPGAYEGTATLIRDGKELDRLQIRTKVGP